MANLVRRDATSTSGGELTSGTQTIAGAKTWTGAQTFSGAITPTGGIVGKTDGVAIAAGYIGETVRTALTASGNTSAGGVYVASGATFTLQPGEYLIDVQAYIQITTTIASTTPAGGFALRTTSPSVTTIEQAFFSYWNVPLASAQIQLMTLRTVVIINTATTYQVAVQSNTASNYVVGILADGTALGGAAGTASSFVRTIRIA